MEAYRKLSAEVISRPTKKKYESLLDSYPLLYGYWIQYAQDEFHKNGKKAAEDVFESALHVCKYSSELWVTYIRFKIETNSPLNEVKEICLRGVQSVGHQFLSHNFWDILIEISKLHNLKLDIMPQHPELGPVEEILYYILKTKTLHQFSRYYKELKQITKLDESHLIELYTRQQTRVSKIWRYERNLKRPFFHPMPLDDGERRTWINYIDFITANEKENLYNRALEIDPSNENLWMRYMRWIIADGNIDAEPYFEKATKLLPSSMTELRLYYALWLELHRPDRVDAYYESLPKTGETYRQYSQYLERKGEDGCSILRQVEPSLDDTEAIVILAELLAYNKDAFAESRRNSLEFFKGWIHHQPERADEIWNKAPAGSIDHEYLLALRRTDIKKFVEMERALNK